MSKSKYHEITFPATKDKRRVLNYEVIGDNTKGNERTLVLRAPDTETKPRARRVKAGPTASVVPAGTPVHRKPDTSPLGDDRT